MQSSSLRMVAIAAAALTFASASSVDLHVCCGCSAPNTTGFTVESALGSVGAAQAVARTLGSGGVHVWIAGGCWGEPLVFTSADSGLPASPTVYSSYAAADASTKALVSERVRSLSPAYARVSGPDSLGAVLTPGWPVLRSQFSAVTDADILAQMAPAARAAVLELDVSAAGFPPTGALSCRTYAAGNACILPGVLPPTQMELFLSPGAAAPVTSSLALTLAQWPNVCPCNMAAPDCQCSFGSTVTPPARWPHVVSVSKAANRTAVLDANTTAHIAAAGWAVQVANDPGSAFVHYFSCAFADLHWALDAVNASAPLPGGNGSITLGTCGDMTVGETHMGAGNYWYAYNLLSEIDAPGEYTLNMSRQSFFAWLPEGAQAAAADAVIGAVSGPGNAVTIDQAEYLTFDGLFIQFAQGAGVAAVDSSFIVIANCTISGVGIMAANFTGGANNTVRASSVLDAGNGGVNVYAGNRTTLTAGNSLVDNCTITSVNRYTACYVPGVSLNGVGNTVHATEIYDAPHTGVFISGNNHEVADCFIHDVVQWAGDSGAIYSGRDTTYRGNRVVNNTFKNLISCAGEVYALYLDDYMSGYFVAGNSFFNTTCSFLGGGRDNTYLENSYNLTRGCPPIKIDQRCFGNTSAELPPIILKFLDRVPYNTSQIWIDSYPHLPDFLTDDPCWPKYNAFIGNTFCGKNGSQFADVPNATLASWGSTEWGNTPIVC